MKGKLQNYETKAKKCFNKCFSFVTLSALQINNILCMFRE